MPSTHHVVTQSALLSDPRLSVRTLGIHERIAPGIIDRPYGTADHLFMLFHDPVTIGAARDRLECPADTMMIWAPGRPHLYGNARASWDHSWVHIAGSDVARGVERAGLPLNRPFALADSHLVDRYLQAIFAEVSGYARPDGVILRNMFENWTRELARALRPADNPSVPQQFLRVKQHLEAHFQQPHRLGDLAARVCLSVPHFCSQFKRYFGVSAIEHLVRLRMQHAAFLLADRSMSVKQVAQAAGYADIYYFSRLFKRHHGASPRAFRSAAGGA